MITESDNYITQEANQESKNILFKPSINANQTDQNNNVTLQGQIGTLNTTSFMNKSSFLTYAKM